MFFKETNLNPDLKGNLKSKASSKVTNRWFTRTLRDAFTSALYYLNNRVFLSRNYRLLVASQKFDVLKTNICPRSEVSRENMLALRTSNLEYTNTAAVTSSECAQLLTDLPDCR